MKAMSLDDYVVSDKEVVEACTCTDCGNWRDGTDPKNKRYQNNCKCYKELPKDRSKCRISKEKDELISMCEGASDYTRYEKAIYYLQRDYR